MTSEGIKELRDLIKSGNFEPIERIKDLQKQCFKNASAVEQKNSEVLAKAAAAEGTLKQQRHFEQQLKAATAQLAELRKTLIQKENEGATLVDKATQLKVTKELAEERRNIQDGDLKLKLDSVENQIHKARACSHFQTQIISVIFKADLDDRRIIAGTVRGDQPFQFDSRQDPEPQIGKELWSIVCENC